MALADGKILVHLKDRRRLVVDVHDVYYLEAQGDETDIRLRSARGLRDVRSLGEVMKDLGPAGFVRIHRNHAVNPGRVREIRLVGRAWQVQLEPPVNKVLPVSRGSLTKLLQAYRRFVANPASLSEAATTHRQEQVPNALLLGRTQVTPDRGPTAG